MNMSSIEGRLVAIAVEIIGKAHANHCPNKEALLHFAKLVYDLATVAESLLEDKKGG